MAEKPPVGIRDVARALNMSISTVSRALNGRPDSSPQTRDRVRKVADELGYFANHSGRSLRSGVTGAVGFVMQTSPGVTGQGDTFFMGVFGGMQSVLSRHQLDLVALLCPSSEDPDEYLRRMVSRGFVDGLVISHTRRIDPRISFLASRQVPFVALGRSDTDAGHSWIDIDFEEIARKSIERFVAAGHTRIALILLRDVNFSRIFLDSAQRTLAEKGLELPRELVFRIAASDAAGYTAAKRILALKDRPTAIAVSNETMVSGLYRGLIEDGVVPGRDIAIIGRDSSSTQTLRPHLTSFHLNLHDLGTALGEALLRTMPKFSAHYPQGVVRHVFPTRFIKGESDGA
ncbi:MAG: LacI family DNA-binding transcriptional regulator [Devosia sp.]